MSKVHFASSIEKIETRQDRTIKIVIGTSLEMSNEAQAILFSLANREAWTVISTDDDITQADIPDRKPDPLLKSKSQSQRLRNVLFVLYKQRGIKDSFEAFYDTQLERFIDRVKEELNEVGA